MSDDVKPFHLDPEGFWPDDSANVSASEWEARCLAGVLHYPESESVVCLCGLDMKEWPQGLETPESGQVGHLPYVEWLAPGTAWPGHSAIAAERGLEQVDSLGSDLPTHDPLGVDGLAGVATNTHGVGAFADADAAIGVDDAGQISERSADGSSLSGAGDVTPYYSDEWLTLYQGDVRVVLPTLPSNSVDTICTSPPFWGLRDYGTATWVGGDESCDHLGEPFRTKASINANTGTGTDRKNTQDRQPMGQTCTKCGAVRQDSQLGLERTPEEYVANLVAIFRELRRVLKPSGTCWLNLGDSYAHTTTVHPPQNGAAGRATHRAISAAMAEGNIAARVLGALKPKDLVGIPWRVAFALQQPYYTGTIKDERDRTWLAALVDGEGTFTILSTTSPHGSGNSYPPIVQVRMTSQGVVQKAASLVGVASPAQYPPSATGNRAVYQWRLSGRRAADIARELYPYLIEKRKQAMVVWNHQAVRDSYTTKRGVTIPADALAKQQVCRDLIRRMNRGEDVSLPSWMVEPPSLLEPGWFLRSDVIWSKPNPMPESVTDRPTKSHEYLFLLTKSARYYFDADAVRERRDDSNGSRNAAILRHGHTDGEPTSAAKLPESPYHAHKGARRGIPGVGTTFVTDDPAGRNLRSVWTIATRPYPGAHFAVFPPELPERCIKAGSSERGVCPECGAPWERVTTKTTRFEGGSGKAGRSAEDANAAGKWAGKQYGTNIKLGPVVDVVTTGWRPTCGCDQVPDPAVVLDPFAGSGTTGMVANRLSRRAILIDLNADYLKQQMKRNAQTPLGLGAA